MSLETISDDYRRVNREMHVQDPAWGRNARHHIEAVRDLVTQAGTKAFLDYGCGKAELKAALEPEGFTVTCYDPCVPEYSAKPEPHDFVTCLDVLEHIEPELLENALLDLKRVTRSVGLFIISTKPSKRILGDGKPAHRIVETYEWWKARLRKHFHLKTIQYAPTQFAVLVAPK